MAHQYALDDCPRTTVYRALDRLLRNDPTLKRLFGRPGLFLSYTGQPEDRQPFEGLPAPSIRLTPHFGGQAWYDPSSQTGDLLVRVQLKLLSADADDLMNAWGAVERAVYPPDPAARLVNAAALQAAGAFTGLVEFSAPADDATGDRCTDGFTYATGLMKLEVLNQLNG